MIETIKEGHEYSLTSVDGGAPQTVRFVEGPADARIADGTTNEAVLQMLINRTLFLNETFQSEHNSRAIAFMQQALAEFEARTEDRKARGVEGTNEL